MFLPAMRHQTVTLSKNSRIDWKGLGYLISIGSVFFLGVVAWPKQGEPGSYMPVLLIGMATSIIGMACRYKAHLDQQREINKAKAEAREARS